MKRQITRIMWEPLEVAFIDKKGVERGRDFDIDADAVLATTMQGDVVLADVSFDEDGFWFVNYDFKDILAWAYLPDPYQVTEAARQRNRRNK